MIKMSEQTYKERYAYAFPRLTEDQMKSIAEVAQCKTYNDGDLLFKGGETDFIFHVIQKGEIAIVDRSGEKSEEILIHEAGEFTGDVANLSGRTSHVDAIAKGKVEVFEICTEELRVIISQEPELSDIILKAFIARSKALRESEFTGIRIIGHELSEDTFRLRDFLSKNRVLFTWIDIETENEMKKVMRQFGVSEKDFPVVAYGNDWILKNPSNVDLATKIGIKHQKKEELYDLVIVGGGPAGLAAAVYGASEGLKTIVLERMAPGGQAGHSSKIENYLGFPTGVSGTDLAERATMQAEKFGAQLDVPSLVEKLHFDNDNKILELSTGETIVSKTVLIATGAEYRKLPIENLEKYEGKGVYYAATQMEATMCGKSRVAIVGGGNSAGQAAVFLSTQVDMVYLIVRGDGLGATMSQYLDQRIQECNNIQLFTNTEIVAIEGPDHPEKIKLSNSKTSKEETIEVKAIFSFIGARPCTSWLPGEIAKDEKGFVITGTSVSRLPEWNLKRQPYLLETSQPGVFAAGDVRSNSVKRVSSAVGDGSMAVQFVHEYLRELTESWEKS